MLMPDKIDFGKKKDRLWDKEPCQQYAGNCHDDERVISSKHKSTHVYASVTAFQSVWGKNGQNYKDNRDQATKFWDLMLSETDETRWKKKLVRMLKILTTLLTLPYTHKGRIFRFFKMHKTFTKIDHMLVHEINFNKSQKITEYVHWPNATKLKVNDNNTSWKAPNIWTLLVKEEIPGVIETYFTLNDNKNTVYKNWEMQL